MHKKKILTHTVLWLIWCTIFSIGGFIRPGPVRWLVLIYNFGTLILIFYIVSSLVVSYNHKISATSISEMNYFERLRFLIFKWEIFLIVFVLIGNISLSWRVDNYFYSLGYYSSRPDNIWIYADGKFARESLYASMGAFYGLYKVTVVLKDRAIEFEKHLNLIARRDNLRLRDLVKNLYKKLDWMAKFRDNDKDEF